MTTHDQDTSVFESSEPEGDDAVPDAYGASVHEGVEGATVFNVSGGDWNDLVDEATVEHATAKDLIAQIEGMQPSDDLYDAKVKVLSEYIDHHVKEEEGQMFPKLKKAKLDTKALGSEMAARK